MPIIVATTVMMLAASELIRFVKTKAHVAIITAMVIIAYVNVPEATSSGIIVPNTSA